MPWPNINGCGKFASHPRFVRMRLRQPSPICTKLKDNSPAISDFRCVPARFKRSSIENLCRGLRRFLWLGCLLLLGLIKVTILLIICFLPPIRFDRIQVGTIALLSVDLTLSVHWHHFIADCVVGTISDTSIPPSISVLSAPLHVESTAVHISPSFHFESRLARLLLTPSQLSGSMSGNKNTSASGRGGTRSNAAAAEPYVSRHVLFSITVPSLSPCLCGSVA
jgi:hypothetical protein